MHLSVLKAIPSAHVSNFQIHLWGRMTNFIIRNIDIYITCRPIFFVCKKYSIRLFFSFYNPHYCLNENIRPLDLAKSIFAITKFQDCIPLMRFESVCKDYGFYRSDFIKKITVVGKKPL